MYYIPILIPAYSPDDTLLTLVKDLINSGFINIIIVNDGSLNASDRIFKELATMKQCVVLNHKFNLGKGLAIKTGLKYYYFNYIESHGIVIADADGQHKPSDICKITKYLENNPNKIIIGKRCLSSGIPLRCFIGNIFTRFLLSVFIKNAPSDTQTGLRAISRLYIYDLIKLPGKRYDYEINMLFYAIKNSIPIQELPISTIYINNNKSSHYKPIHDSLNIYNSIMHYLYQFIRTKYCNWG